MDKIKSKVKNGLLWVVAERLFFRSFSFIRTIILARLLSSSDYGLFGIVANVLLFVDVLTRTGFQAALIQKKENIEEYLDVAWTINFLRGIIETIILISLAIPLAKFYNDSQLVPLLFFSSITIVISSLESIRLITLNKKLQMGKLSRFSFVVTVLSFIFSLGLAVWLRNVWALVGGVVVQKLIYVIGSYIIAPYHPRLHLDKIIFKELWNFGKWEYLSGIFITIFMHGDDLFVGKVLGVTQLGYYSMSYNIGNVISFELVDAFRKVLFPAFSAIQDDISRLKSSYLSIYHLTVFVGCIIAIGLFLLAPQFVDVFLGEQWTPIIPTLKILSIWGGVQMISTSTAPLFRAVNRPDWFAKIQMFKLISLIILIIPFTNWWGLEGVALSVLVSSLLELPVGINWTRSALGCKLKEILLPLIIPIVSGLCVGILYYVGINSFDLPAFYHLIIFGILITIMYILISLILDKVLHTGLMRVFQSAFNKKS